MRFARFKQGRRIAYGIVHQDSIEAITTTPFLPYERTGELYDLEELELLAPCIPSKVIGIALNYYDHIREMGKEAPSHPVFFYKPSTAVIGPRGSLVAPSDSAQLDYEGELGVVIGKVARNVAAKRFAEVVLGYTCGIDATARDFQRSDGQWGRAKGFDTSAPLGPWVETQLDPADLGLVTRVNGAVKQDGRTSQMVFDVPALVSFVTRYVTLLPGDVILTGTPAGSTVVNPGDVVEVEVTAGEQSSESQSSGILRSPIVEADYRLDPPGAMPQATAAERAAAYGARHQPAAPPHELLDGLRQVATATLAAVLRKRGLNTVTLDGLRSTRPAQKLAGYARTVRYLPLREDLSATHAAGMNAQKRAIEEIRPGEVLVIEARGDTTAGTIGDILALRAQVRGAAGVVTDGAIRDSAALASLDIPVYYAAVHPAVLGRRHVPWETGVTVACAGVTIQPGDLLVGDADGIVVVPPELAADVLAEAREQERQETFIAERVAAGESVDGLFPLPEARRAEYQAWSKDRP